ncbi:hypothetical protein CBR_g37634 [Chara braunii]|uniref:DDE Tnp4 domain-containing protein n=1 Tax=Chara braunii TaxID=69332 RepID=A0A388LNM1_CHABU|nr:hypothetical protein CBR_g37634 [Chara braunii]|eukprot:GBG83835.1 hypothetical protein CBR_g37634 [Chara braunii]
MKWSSFNRILDILRPHLQKQVTRYRMPLHPAQVLAYAIHRWAHGDSQRHSTSAYGMGKTSGLRAVRMVAVAIIKCFPGNISFGSYEDRNRIMQAFADRGFPNCLGCIDETHIYLDKPRNMCGDDFCSGRTKRFSIVAQLVFDAYLRIVDLFFGFPGKSHDSRVLRNSSLYRRALKGDLFRDDPDDPHREERPPVDGVPNSYLLGDNGYPILPWIVSPYGGTTVGDEVLFDSLHRVARCGAERGIGIFKLRWQYFHRQGVRSTPYIGTEFRAACILHNVLRKWGDIPEEGRRFTAEELTRFAHVP